MVIFFSSHSGLSNPTDQNNGNATGTSTGVTGPTDSGANATCPTT